MNWFRKGLAGLLAIVLFFALLGAAYTISLNRTFGTSEKVKVLLAESGIYDRLADALLTQSQQETEQGAGDSSVSFNNPVVEQEIDKAFTPALMQSSVNTFVDANYAWLEGKTDKPSFAIDLTSAKDNFAERVGEFVSERLATLSVCTPEQQAMLQFPIDPLTVECRPATLEPQAEGQRITREINNGNFLSQETINPETFNKDEDSPEQPYYQKLENAPKLFQLAQKAPWLLGALALLTALGVIFISPVRRRGLRKVGILLLLTGVLLIATKLVADTVINKLESRSEAAVVTANSELDEVRNKFIGKVEAQLTQTNMAFGIGYIVLSLPILGHLVRTRGQSGPAVSAETPTPREPAQPVDVRDRLKPSGPARPKPPSPQGPRPARRKPPRLIQ